LEDGDLVQAGTSEVRWFLGLYPQDGRYSATGSGVIAERITAIRKSKHGRHPNMAKVMSVVPCGGDIACALLRNVSSESQLPWRLPHRYGRAGKTPEEERLALCGRPLGGHARLQSPVRFGGPTCNMQQRGFYLHNIISKSIVF